MATRVQHRRGTTADHQSFVGEEAEFTFDTTLKNVRIHDGVTAGGFLLVRKDELLTVHSTSDPTPDTIMRRDANARTQVEVPAAEKDSANKVYVDDEALVLGLLF